MSADSPDVSKLKSERPRTPPVAIPAMHPLTRITANAAVAKESRMKTRRVLRYEISINDQPTTIPAGKVVHLSEYRLNTVTGERNRVEVWVEVLVGGSWPAVQNFPTQRVQIFGTGHPLPVDALHLASTLDGPLVWHLYQLTNLKDGS